jgi:hypothetical protein
VQPVLGAVPVIRDRDDAFDAMVRHHGKIVGDGFRDRKRAIGGERRLNRKIADLFRRHHGRCHKACPTDQGRQQRNDPGLNISLYTNTKVDKILEDLIAASDPAVQAGKISDFEREIRTDQPAIFIYAPEFIYMEGGDVQGVQLDHLTQASERFLGVRNWYIRTDAVWKFLQPKSTEQNEAQN